VGVRQSYRAERKGERKRSWAWKAAAIRGVIHQLTGLPHRPVGFLDLRRDGTATSTSNGGCRCVCGERPSCKETEKAFRPLCLGFTPILLVLWVCEGVMGGLN
jgi:hypothetical protein